MLFTVGLESTPPVPGRHPRARVVSDVRESASFFRFNDESSNRPPILDMARGSFKAGLLVLPPSRKRRLKCLDTSMSVITPGGTDHRKPGAGGNTAADSGMVIEFVRVLVKGCQVFRWQRCAESAQRLVVLAHRDGLFTVGTGRAIGAGGGTEEDPSAGFEKTRAIANETPGAVAVGHDRCLKRHQQFFPRRGGWNGSQTGCRPTSIRRRSSKC